MFGERKHFPAHPTHSHEPGRRAELAQVRAPPHGRRALRLPFPAARNAKLLACVAASPRAVGEPCRGRNGPRGPLGIACHSPLC
jgi:hypothetical protein